MNKTLLKHLRAERTDMELLKAISTSSDEDAFFILYNRYSSQLLRYFYHAVNDQDVISDLSQNFWLHVWQNAGRLVYENHDSAERLFLNIAVKRAADYFRSSAYQRELPLDSLPELADKESMLPLPESDCHAEEIQLITARVLSKYPELDKQIFICQKELDYPAQHTADIFKISTADIYKRVSIIMKDLRFQLKLAGYYSVLLTCCVL